jgi:heat shock protein HslJ
MTPSLLTDTEITLTFEVEQASGSAGCNSYSGSYTLDHGALRFGGIAITEMYCLIVAGFVPKFGPELKS